VLMCTQLQDPHHHHLALMMASARQRWSHHQPVANKRSVTPQVSID